MKRYRVIIAGVVLMLVAFVVAVQRDTFVRRWCLLTPPPASRPAGVLGKVIDDFPLDGLTREEALERLERVSGAKIELSPVGGDWRDGPMVGHVRYATVEQILWRLIGGTFDLDGGAPLIEEPVGEIKRAGHVTSYPFTTRAYNLSSFLQQENGRSAGQWEVMKSSWGSGTTSTDPMVQAAGMIRSLTELHMTLGPSTAPPPPSSVPAPNLMSGSYVYVLNNDPVLRFGNRVIVVASPRSHWVISEVLREEAEVRRISAAGDFRRTTDYPVDRK